MVGIQISAALERRLERIAKRFGKSKTALAREAIIERIDELEAEYLAEKRTSEPGRSRKRRA
jgi:RHH-type rel operon transcriptional repressor/antitoxin RelB